MVEKEWVFIDDAGDPGFKKGSSKHFLIACVVFSCAAEAEKTAKIMTDLRDKLGWKDRAEFKFNKTRKDVIIQLFRLLTNVDFKIYATLIDKSSVTDAYFKQHPGEFYNHIIKETILLCDLNNAKVRLDGHAGRNYMKSATAYFRKAVNITDRKITDIRFSDSAKNVLIQLADLIAGAIMRSTKPDKTDSQIYIKLLERKISVLKAI